MYIKWIEHLLGRTK